MLDSGIYRSFNNANYVWVSGNDYRSTFGSDSLAPVVGKTITGNNIPANTRIDGGFISASGNYGYLDISQRITGNINQNTSKTT